MFINCYDSIAFDQFVTQCHVVGVGGGGRLLERSYWFERGGYQREEFIREEFIREKGLLEKGLIRERGLLEGKLIREGTY